MWPQLVEPVASGSNRPAEFQDATAEPLEDLVEKRLFFDIVDKTKQLIEQAEEPRDQEELMALLQVWVWRFRALLATRQGAIVAQEAQQRMDLLDELPATQPVWDLRLLLVPVRSKGINKAALQLIYSMGTEARTELMADSGNAEWTARLRRLGLEVAALLVGMRDLPTAIHHLEALYTGEMYVQGNEWADKLAHALTMSYIYLGDTSRASEWAAKTTIDTSLVRAFATEDYKAVLSNTDDSVVAINLRALAHLHQGQTKEAIELFEAALEKEANPSLLFNLFMAYDLVENNPAIKKQQIWDQLAARFQSISTYVI